MHRIDVRELNSALQSLARLPILSGFRYQRGAGAQVALALDVKRFADARVLAAVADRAVATTLITTEGRALTEVALQVRNRAQAFLKVTLPPGGTIVSVEVAAESAKPVVGADGVRVPLLRPGFRPTGAYSVSFVYLHAEAPFARKGELQMALPKMDIPVGLVEWEMFVPDRYVAEAIDGNVIDRGVLALMTDRRTREQPGSGSGSAAGGGFGAGVSGGVYHGGDGGVYVSLVPGALPGQIRGHVRDSSGSPLPGATIVIEVGSSHQAAITAGDGTFLISGVPPGAANISAQLAGFLTQRHTLTFDEQARQVEFVLPGAAVAEAVTVAKPAACRAPEPRVSS
jgi:hypothetical protein